MYLVPSCSALICYLFDLFHWLSHTYVVCFLLYNSVSRTAALLLLLRASWQRNQIFSTGV
ncbi:hypothetical protein BJX99DRAFT_223891 [Aspergillus californicus]